MGFNRAPVVKVTFTLRDQDRVSYSSIYLGKNTTGLLWTDVNSVDFHAYITEFATNLQALTDCFVESINVSLEWLNDAPRTFGTAADVERKAVLQFKTASGFYTLFTIPGAKYDMFDPSTGIDIISTSAVMGDFVGNPLQTELENIHDKIVNGATIATVNYPATDRRHDNIQSLWDAYKQHRSNTRG